MLVAVLPAGASTITAVGSLAQTNGTGKTTLAVSPQHVGDAMVLSVGVFSTGATVSSISGGGSTWAKASSTTADGGDTEVWLGTVTATGSSTITVTFSASVASKATELDAQEFSSSTGSSTTWALDVAGNASSSSSSTTVTLPTLSPAGSGELYVDYTPVDNAAAAGSTSGFTYDVTSEGSLFAYDLNVSASVSPTASQSPAGGYVEAAALLTASSSGSGTSSTTTLTASPSSPQNPATSITLTATVTTGATGTVNFELGGTSLSGCSAKTVSSSVATCTTTALAAGTNSFVAIYSGDSTYNGSTSSTLSYVGLTAQATLTVTSTSGTYGTALTLTTSGGSGSGTVTYTTTSGTASGCAVSSGSLSSTSTGTCIVTATKASDGTYQSISSSATTVTLSTATSTTTTLTASPSSPQSAGTSITLTATVTTGATGTVNFELGGSSLSGCSAKTLSSSVATCTTTALAAGTNSFVAIYSGDSTHLTSTSSTLSYVGGVGPGAPTGVTVTVLHGNAKVSWTAPTPVSGATVVGYTATAVAGGSNVGTCVVTATSTSCTIPDLPLVSSISFSVTASSATATGPSSSSTSAGPFALLASTTTLSASQASPQNINAPITLIALVTSGAMGTVSFDAGGSAITNCATQAVSSGASTCTTSFSSAGTYTLTAVYSGDTIASGYSNYSGSTSSSLSFVISSTSLTASTTSLTILPTAGPYGSPITLTTSGGAGTGAITYSVTNGTNTGCSVSGATLTATSSGTCLVTAIQASDGTYLGESSNVTTINFFWYYAATYEIVSETPVYTEEEVETGETCTQYGGGQCQVWAPTYTEEEVLTGYTPNWEYVCPSGGTLSGYTCTISGGSGPNVRHAFSSPAGVVDSPHVSKTAAGRLPQRPKPKHRQASYQISVVYVRKDHLEDLL